MELIENYLSYIGSQKRYSPRTREIYSDVLQEFLTFWETDDPLPALTHNGVRAYQIYLMDERKLNARTVNLHLSVLSGFCRHLVRSGHLKSNPVQLVTRPKQSKRLPQFFKEGAMDRYLSTENALSRRDFDLDLQTEEERRDTYALCLDRAIVTTLYSTGMRRAELIGLKRSDVDSSRRCIHVTGKGDKMREIPLVSSCIQEISLYLQAVNKLVGPKLESDRLFVTYGGKAVYAMLVDRAVKAELGAMGQEFSGKKSPHVLRHSLATALMEEGAELNSIKEVLGHANLAATQVYTHSSPAQLKKAYLAAHPRSGNNGNGKDNG